MMSKIKSIKFFLSFLLIILSYHIVYAQSAVDSLNLEIQKAKEDSIKVKLLNNVGQLLSKVKQEQGKAKHLEALEIARKANDKNGEASSLKFIANFHQQLSEYNEAIDYYKQSLAIFESLKNNEEIAELNLNLGAIYQHQSNYSNAIEHFLKATQIFSFLKNNKRIATIYNLIGELYRLQKNEGPALEYYQKALNIFESEKDLPGMSSVYNNLGIINKGKGNYDLAINFYLKSLGIRKELGDKEGEAQVYNNIGNIYYYSRNYIKALHHQEKALEIQKELKNQRGIAISYDNIGSIYVEKGNVSHNQADYLKAIENLEKSIEIARQINYTDVIMDAYYVMSTAYEGLGKNAEALKLYKSYSALKDSVFNVANLATIDKIQARYDKENSEKEINLLKREKDLQDLEINRQGIIKKAFIGGIFLLVIVLVLFINRFRLKHKANRLLTNQKEEIEVKNLELVRSNELVQLEKEKAESARILLEEQNQYVKDSINYARIIQNTILPAKERLQKAFPHSCIFYKPKDVVSGDFYFYAKQGDNHIIAAVDCTGHGVPGAFMSIIGYDNLNRIIFDYGITQPSKILDKLQEEIIKSMKKGEDSKEAVNGMDVALCNYNFEKKELQFAGAQRPLYYIKRKGNEAELIEIKGDKGSIGNEHSSEIIFTNHTFKLNHKDSFYIFSDGFADQFGESNDKKYMTKNLKNFLLGIQNSHIENHHALLDEELNKWKGNSEQTDDVLVIGIRYRLEKRDTVKIEFTETEVLFLKNFIPRFQSFSIYNTGDIINELNKIVIDSDNIRLWKEQVEKAAYGFEEERYFELLNV